MNDLTYSHVLKNKLAGEGRKRKGELTRDRLKVATAKLLNDVSYRDLRVKDICTSAKVSLGTFYLYYENKVEITIDVMEEFAGLFYTEVENRPNRSAFQAIQDANFALVRLARANPGLMQCLLQLSEDEADFGNFESRINHSWTLRMAQSMVRHLKIEDLALAHFTANAMSAMMDHWMYRLFVTKDPFIGGLVADMDLSDEDMCECLSVLWYRAVYGGNPEGIKSEAAKSIAAMGH